MYFYSRSFVKDETPYKGILLEDGTVVSQLFGTYPTIEDFLADLPDA
jgi:hypothetical protein